MNQVNENEVGDVLTLKQERFCRYYAQDSNLYGNGVLAFAEAYEYDLDNADRTRDIDEKGNEIKGTSDYDRQYNTCAVSANRLLIKDNIIKRINELLNEQLNDTVIDARLSEIILHGDDKDSIAAIKEYNKLKQRIVDKLDLTSKGEAIDGFNFIRNDKENNADNKAD